MIFKKIVFLCSKQIKGERSLAAIYHLLTGKRSIQTVQDAHLYQITPFYGILPFLHQKYFNQQINEFIINKYVKSSSQNKTILLTEKGDEWLQNNDHICLTGFNGISYGQFDMIFLNRLLLFIQMLTNSKMDNYTYMAIVDDPTITSWAKQTYVMIGDGIDETTKNLHKELSILLNQLTEQEANIFVDRLTGYKTYGLSINQLADHYHLHPLDIQLTLVLTTHKMLQIISKHKNSFPILQYVSNDLQKEKFITNTAYKTYQLLNNGHSTSDIARIRNLKENTIFDHLVEISLYDHEFPFEQYLNNDIYKEIIQATLEQNSFKLKDIKDQVNPNISYFQIRLALAKQSFEKGSIDDGYKV